MFKIEVATAYDPHTRTPNLFFDFRGTGHKYTSRTKAEADFDLIVKFDRPLAVRLLDNENNILVAWDVEDGLWSRD